MLAEAWRIPSLADVAFLVGDASLVSHAPSHSDRSPYLHVDAEATLQPVTVAGYILGRVGSGGSPDRVGDVGTLYIILVGGEGVAHTTIEAIDVVLVAQEIPIDTDTSVS